MEIFDPYQLIPLAMTNQLKIIAFPMIRKTMNEI